MRINDQFPIEHIQAFGAGTVGPINVVFDSNGKIVFASAELYDATFEIMLIDDPNILRIFGDGSGKINMNVLHPWPRFRLDPLGPISEGGEAYDVGVNEFLVGRLTDITHLPAMARFEVPRYIPTKIGSFKEGAVYKSILQRFGEEAEKVGERGKYREDPDLAAPKRASTRFTAKRRSPRTTRAMGTENPLDDEYIATTYSKGKQTTLHDSSEQNSRPTTRRSSTWARSVHKTPVPPPPSKVTGHTPQAEHTAIVPKPRHRFTNIIPQGPQRAKVQNVVNEMFALLPDAAARERYNHYVVVARKEVAKDPDRKTRFHEELHSFVKLHDVVELHNQYANLTRSGTNRIYQLPTFVIEGQPAGQQSNGGLHVDNSDSPLSEEPQSHESEDSAGLEDDDWS